jgi:hypothetical protein
MKMEARTRISLTGLSGDLTLTDLIYDGGGATSSAWLYEIDGGGV